MCGNEMARARGKKREREARRQVGVDNRVGKVFEEGMG